MKESLTETYIAKINVAQFFFGTQCIFTTLLLYICHDEIVLKLQLTDSSLKCSRVNSCTRCTIWYQKRYNSSMLPWKWLKRHAVFQTMTVHKWQYKMHPVHFVIHVTDKHNERALLYIRERLQSEYNLDRQMRYASPRGRPRITITLPLDLVKDTTAANRSANEPAHCSFVGGPQVAAVHGGAWRSGLTDDDFQWTHVSRGHVVPGPRLHPDRFYLAQRTLPGLALRFSVGSTKTLCYCVCSWWLRRWLPKCAPLCRRGTFRCNLDSTDYLAHGGGETVPACRTGGLPGCNRSWMQ